MKKNSKILAVVVIAVVVLAAFFALVNKTKEENGVPSSVTENGQANISRSILKELGKTVSKTLRFDGSRRSYTVHVPKSYDGHDMPLVVVLHGGGHDAPTVEGMSSFSQKAEKEGFIVVYPEGVGLVKTWNAGFCCGKALDDNVNDVAYVGALIDEIDSKYGVDRDKVFVTGVSNGGFLAHRVGAELSGEVTAIAPIAASLGDFKKPSSPVSVIMFHGKKDRNVPYEGGVGLFSVSRVDNKSLQEAVDFWLNANSCSATPQTSTISEGITRDVYGNCKDGVEVQLYTLDEGGHDWYSTANSGISATDIMWDFFVNNSR